MLSEAHTHTHTYKTRGFYNRQPYIANCIAHCEEFAISDVISTTCDGIAVKTLQTTGPTNFKLTSHYVHVCFQTEAQLQVLTRQYLLTRTFACTTTYKVHLKPKHKT